MPSFRKPVSPATGLELHVRKLQAARANIWRFACQGNVAGDKGCPQAEISATDDSPQNRSLARMDPDVSDTFIHPMAVVEKGAEPGHRPSFRRAVLHISVLSVIGDGARLVSNIIDSRRPLYARCGLEGFTPWRSRCAAQKFKQGRSARALTIGRDCVIREGVTMHLGLAITDPARPWLATTAIFITHANIAHDFLWSATGSSLASVAHAGGPREYPPNAVQHWAGLRRSQVRGAIGHDAFIGGNDGRRWRRPSLCHGGRQTGLVARPQRGRAAPSESHLQVN